MIKPWLRRLLNRFGIIAFKRSSRVYVPEDESYKIVATLVAPPDPIVIDSRAHLEDMVDRLGALLPSATFHCFEPDPELAQAIGSKYAGKQNIHVTQAALGAAAATARFNIHAASAANSLLSFADELDPGLDAARQLMGTAEVSVTTIDEYCQSHAIQTLDVLKLDLQGYDYLALRGAENILENTRLVLTEVLFQEIYSGCHQFKDIFCWLTEKGFHLYTLCGLHYGVRHELMWADAIFIRQAESDLKNGICV